jgi:hypothetical protein
MLFPCPDERYGATTERATLMVEMITAPHRPLHQRPQAESCADTITVPSAPSQRRQPTCPRQPARENAR